MYLDDVKNALGITGNYQDGTIQGYIDEVVAFLLDAGVKKCAITSGIVARGVADLWNYGAGDGKLSSYFMMRATQLSYKPCSSASSSSSSDDSDSGDSGSDTDTGMFTTCHISFENLTSETAFINYAAVQSELSNQPYACAVHKELSNDSQITLYDVILYMGRQIVEVGNNDSSCSIELLGLATWSGPNILVSGNCTIRFRKGSVI